MVLINPTDLLILFVVRLVGLMVIIVLYAKLRHIRYVFGMAGWLFWALSPLVRPIDSLNVLGNFVSQVFASLGTVLIIISVIIFTTRKVVSAIAERATRWYRSWLLAQMDAPRTAANAEGALSHHDALHADTRQSWPRHDVPHRHGAGEHGFR